MRAAQPELDPDGVALGEHEIDLVLAVRKRLTDALVAQAVRVPVVDEVLESASQIDVVGPSGTIGQHARGREFRLVGRHHDLVAVGLRVHRRRQDFLKGRLAGTRLGRRHRYDALTVLPRGQSHTQLPQQFDLVRHGPDFDDLPVLEPECADFSNVDGFSGRRDAEEISFVRPLDPISDTDHVPICDHQIDGIGTIGKCVSPG